MTTSSIHHDRRDVAGNDPTLSGIVISKIAAANPDLDPADIPEKAWFEWRLLTDYEQEKLWEYAGYPGVLMPSWQRMDEDIRGNLAVVLLIQEYREGWEAGL